MQTGQAPIAAPWVLIPPMTQPVERALLARLPELAGGWQQVCYEVLEGVQLKLVVPAAPDQLLDDVDVQERNRFNDAMPYWAWVWDAAPIMARQLLRELSILTGPQPLRVLELGAGLGLVGLWLGSAFGDRIELTLTDYDRSAVEALGVEIELNGLEGIVRAEALDWTEPWVTERGSFDVMIASDVLYEARSHGPILDLLQAALRPGGSAWFADPGRPRSPLFIGRAQARGLIAKVLDEAGVPQEPESGSFRLFRVQRPKV